MEPRALARLAPARATPSKAGIQSLVRDLNHAYRDEPALWELDFDPSGFYWIEPNDADANVVAFARTSKDVERVLVCVAEPLAGRRAARTASACRAPGAGRSSINTDAELLRRHRRRQPRRRRGRADPVARPAVLGGDHAAAARSALARAG